MVVVVVVMLLPVVLSGLEMHWRCRGQGCGTVQRSSWWPLGGGEKGDHPARRSASPPALNINVSLLDAFRPIRNIFMHTRYTGDT